MDGCPRCAEYAAHMGIDFDPDRWRAFWKKMCAVEFDDVGGYDSALDKTLGRVYYTFALALQRATGYDPRLLMDAVLVEKKTLERIADQASLARTALDDPEALPEGELAEHLEDAEAYDRVFSDAAPHPPTRYAVDSIDGVLLSLRLLYDPEEVLAGG